MSKAIERAQRAGQMALDSLDDVLEGVSSQEINAAAKSLASGSKDDPDKLWGLMDENWKKAVLVSAACVMNSVVLKRLTRDQAERN